MIRRANIGCGSVPADGWDNYDIDTSARNVGYWDLRQPLIARDPARRFGYYDYVVAHHVLCALDHHELPVALRNIHAVLRPGGVLRVSVPDAVRGFDQWRLGRVSWFPQDERIEGRDSRFCTWLTWFGTHKSIFTEGYVERLLVDAGFHSPRAWRAEEAWSTGCMDDRIRELDSRFHESLYMEAWK
jgi:predicted SAM-dependent methyltransferase